MRVHNNACNRHWTTTTGQFSQPDQALGCTRCLARFMNFPIFFFNRFFLDSFIPNDFFCGDFSRFFHLIFAAFFSRNWIFFPSNRPKCSIENCPKTVASSIACEKFLSCQSAHNSPHNQFSPATQFALAPTVGIIHLHSSRCRSAFAVSSGERSREKNGSLLLIPCIRSPNIARFC